MTQDREQSRFLSGDAEGGWDIIAQRVRGDRPDQAEVFCGEVAPAVADEVGRGGPLVCMSFDLKYRARSPVCLSRVPRALTPTAQKEVRSDGRFGASLRTTFLGQPVPLRSGPRLTDCCRTRRLGSGTLE